jgi:hypothetical protein
MAETTERDATVLALKREFAEWLSEHRAFLSPQISDGDAYLCWISGHAAAMKQASGIVTRRMARAALQPVKESGNG